MTAALCSASSAIAYEHSEQLLKCMETDLQRGCFLAEIKIFDGLLNDSYKDILGHLEKATVLHKKFNGSQIAWLKFATQNREFIRSLATEGALAKG